MVVVLVWHWEEVELWHLHLWHLHLWHLQLWSLQLWQLERVVFAVVVVRND
jgi:hypothetical protein